MLEPLSLHDWLVVDRGQEFLTGDGVIGHIQVFLGIWEALNKNTPLERSFFANIEGAIDSFAPWLAEKVTDENITVEQVTLEHAAVEPQAAVLL